MIWRAPLLLAAAGATLLVSNGQYSPYSKVHLVSNREPGRARPTHYSVFVDKLRIQDAIDYPLFGANLQHSVVYVDTERLATPVCQRRGLIRDRPDAAAWLQRIRELRIDYIVRTGRPYEVNWIEARSDAFELLLQIDPHAIYQVHAAALAK